jgi:hypothetical protein
MCCREAGSWPAQLSITTLPNFAAFLSTSPNGRHRDWLSIVHYVCGPVLTNHPTYLDRDTNSCIPPAGALLGRCTPINCALLKSVAMYTFSIFVFFRQLEFCECQFVKKSRFVTNYLTTFWQLFSNFLTNFWQFFEDSLWTTFCWHFLDSLNFSHVYFLSKIKIFA